MPGVSFSFLPIQSQIAYLILVYAHIPEKLSEFVVACFVFSFSLIHSLLNSIYLCKLLLEIISIS